MPMIVTDQAKGDKMKFSGVGVTVHIYVVDALGTVDPSSHNSGFGVVFHFKDPESVFRDTAESSNHSWNRILYLR